MDSEAGGREGWSEDYISNPRPPCLFFFWNSPISSSKSKTTGNSTWRFLRHPRNSTLLLINPWKFDMLFLWYPLMEIPYPQPFCLVFFWNSPFTVNFVILLQLSGWSFFFFFWPFGHSIQEQIQFIFLKVLKPWETCKYPLRNLLFRSPHLTH